MNEKVKQAFKLLCEQYVKDLNRYENKKIDKDYFYNPKYKCGFEINGENVYFSDILKALDDTEELIAEQHRLFDLAKEQENELNELKEFVRIILSKNHFSSRFEWIKVCNTPEEYNNIFVERSRNRLNDAEFDLVKKVVEKYGNKKD